MHSLDTIFFNKARKHLFDIVPFNKACIHPLNIVLFNKACTQSWIFFKLSLHHQSWWSTTLSKLVRKMGQCLKNSSFYHHSTLKWPPIAIVISKYPNFIIMSQNSKTQALWLPLCNTITPCDTMKVTFKEKDMELTTSTTTQYVNSYKLLSSSHPNAQHIEVCPQSWFLFHLDVN